MIEFIKLSEISRIEFTQKESGEFLGEFGQINVFIGKNNNGKSRLMRTLLNDAKIFFLDLSINKESFEELKQNFFRKLKGLIYSFPNDHPFKVEMSNFINKSNQEISGIEANYIFFQKVNQLLSLDTNNTNSILLPSDRIGISFKAQLNENLESFNNTLKRLCIPRDETKLLYIPIMRGLRPIQYENKVFTNLDIYNERTRFDYNITGPITKIFTGLSMYEDIKRLLLGTEQQRQLISDFQKFLEDHIFYDTVTLIPKYDGDVLHIKIGSNDQIEIFNLGDGLQTIITILFPLFIRKDNETYVFIEEPETHLHPEWQSKLLNSIKEFKNHQFFISSHSTSFINDNETRVFSVVKEDNIITIDKVNDDAKRSLIFDLGYRPSDLLLANYILWVEGQSDKIYIQKLLAMYAPDLKEGIHYTIMLFGGENYRHFIPGEEEIDLSIFKSLNSNFGIILDSDRYAQDSQINEHKLKIKTRFSEVDAFCWITKNREIENYIPIEIFKKAVLKVHKKSNIEIPKGLYDDRNTLIDLDNKNLSYKATIKLPQDIFSQIQKNKDGTTRDIEAKVLRKAVEEAIQNTKKSTFTIRKVEVAKEIALHEFEIESDELKDKMKELIECIRKAN